MRLLKCPTETSIDSSRRTLLLFIRVTIRILTCNKNFWGIYAKITTIGNKIIPYKDSRNFVNKFISQRKGVNDELVCQHMILKQVH